MKIERISAESRMNVKER